MSKTKSADSTPIIQPQTAPVTRKARRNSESTSTIISPKTLRKSTGDESPRSLTSAIEQIDTMQDIKGKLCSIPEDKIPDLYNSKDDKKKFMQLKDIILYLITYFDGSEKYISSLNFNLSNEKFKQNFLDNSLLFINTVITKRKYSALQILVECGLNFNAQDKDGNTALHLAIINKDIEAVKAILKYDVNLEITNNKNQDALDLATELKQNEIRDLLIQIWPKKTEKSSSIVYELAELKTNLVEENSQWRNQVVEMPKLKLLCLDILRQNNTNAHEFK
ncbi:MAG: ankyrin repeat domain-containing protein [Alphaproteobacteria bacterium]|nr:ankyrin repeat domain-containing protein [Alphaproteobacteria bacterium]OJV13755.1 MAG: hypothetical protein BGO27_01490 [Alphaproteobacteria bacterium 33-17]